MAQVTVLDHGASVTLANGVISADIETSRASVISLTYKGFQLLAQAGSTDIYYSMDGGSTFESPQGCKLTIVTQTPDLIDLSFKRLFTNQHHAVDIDIHFVLRRGDSGLYTYAILTHPAHYPATTIGEWRQVWKVPVDTLEDLFVDSLRHLQMPNSFDFAHAIQTNIAEVRRLTTGVQAGQLDSKYKFTANYWDLGTWGQASSKHGIGAWDVLGAHEYFNDGPTKNDLTASTGLNLVHFGLDHYNSSLTTVAAGETWSKIYGPFVLYMNSCPGDANACWTNAQERAKTEAAQWPYTWVKDSNYPPAASRSTVTGTFIVHDPLKPNVSSNGAWVGLAQPDPGGNWQFESKRYQYWTRAAADGSFSIPHVRAGTYTLSAFTEGAVGEFTKAGVKVSAGATPVGTLTWDVVHPGRSIAWEIGIPDRTAKEFRHGSTDYFTPFLWTSFSSEFPNPLEYNVGTSNPATDWNYAHSGYLVGSTWTPWKWRVNFNLGSVPASGNATLTLALASANQAALDVFVNDEATVFHEVSPAITGGNALVREGIHAKYDLELVQIPVSRLKVGANTITLVERRTGDPADHVMYDYLNLELP